MSQTSTTAPDPATPFEAARAQFLQGVACLQAGRADDARRALEASLDLVPGRPSTLTNLGVAWLRLGQPGRALPVLQQALDAEPGNVEALGHCGAALGELGRPADALDHLDKALELDPGRPAVWFHRAQCLHRLDRSGEALEALAQALKRDPALGLAWSLRGSILKDLRRPAEAADAFRQAIASGADEQLNRYFLASVSDHVAPEHPPAQYVAQLFDEYAAEFDQHLVQGLRYRAPGVLVQQLRALDARRWRHALDLGCGTGLCGPLLQPLVDRLDGVDLSGQMLERARALGVYRELHQADLVGHLRATPERHDLLVAADVFIYVGALEAVFAGVQRVLLPGGVFSFSVEHADDAQDWVLRPSLRYAHSARYVARLAAQHGLAVIGQLEQPIREDQREPVKGLFFCLARR